MRPASPVVLLLLALLPACRAKPLVPVAPERVIGSGATHQFGPGPVLVSEDGRNLVMELGRPATAWFYNAHSDGWLDRLSVTALPAGRTEVALPLWAGERLSGRRTRARELQVTGSSHARIRVREALLVVIWERGVDPDPPASMSYDQIRVVDPADPSELPAAMFRGRRVVWAAWLLR